MNKDIKEEKGRVNPFFLPYDTQHDTVPFDRIELADYEEAMMSPDSAKWLEAMKSEMGSMYENKVWTLVDLPDDRK